MEKRNDLENSNMNSDLDKQRKKLIELLELNEKIRLSMPEKWFDQTMTYIFNREMIFQLYDTLTK